MVITILLIVVGLVALFVPVLTDARHWWPRKANKKGD
jgi:hypothetical protein